MLKKRLIPIVLLKNGLVVQSKGFKRYQALGNPVTIVQRLSDWAADELIYLDISSEARYDLKRDDLKVNNRHSFIEILQDISKKCFMPLTIGGLIRTKEDVRARIYAGADKVCLNSKPLDDPGFIETCAKEFGSQCIVISIDAMRLDSGKLLVFKYGGKTPTSLSPTSWAAEVEKRGAGEILINSIDRDGRGQGYDLSLIQSVAQAVNIPVIACGGVGNWGHFKEGIIEGGADAVAAANIFHYSENSVYNAKSYLYDSGLNFRKPLWGKLEVI